MKILVTGAAGFIGSHLTERLLQAGHTVHALDAFTAYYDPQLKEQNAAEVTAAGATVFRQDLATDDLSEALAGVEVIFHAAAQPGLSASTPFETYERNNVLATERLLEAAERCGMIKLFVNLATSSIYGLHANSLESAEPLPASHYGVTKLAAEQLVLARTRARGFPGVSLRIFSVYGERERPDKLYHKLIKSILEERPFPLYEGSRDHKRSYTYVGDIVDGCMRVLEHQDACIGQIINLGNDAVHTTGEGIALIEEILGKEARFEMLPARMGDQQETGARIEKARALLGFHPTTDLHEGLTREIAWYRSKVLTRSA